MAYDNRSTWKAFEVSPQHKAFPVHQPLYCQDPAGPQQTSVNKIRRSAHKFQWMSEAVTVTSFNDADGYVVACSYSCTESKDCKKCGHIIEWPREKVLHRYKITHADLRAAKKEAA